MNDRDHGGIRRRSLQGRDPETRASGGQALALLSIELRIEQDVPLARRRAREIAEQLRLRSQDAIRLSTAVSEMARNAFRYARGGRVAFRVEPGEPAWLMVTVSDQGPGIAALDAVLAGRHQAATGTGMGIVGTRRLMERFAITSGSAGTVVDFGLPAAGAVTPADVAGLVAALARASADDPLQELQRQNQELLRTLGELRERQDDLARLNRELEDTNRGVVALYAELDERADAMRRAAELKTRFLSDITHEFRTPLNSIISLATMLLQRTDGPLTAEQETQSRLIEKTARGLGELVDDLLDLAKAEAGKLSVRVSDFSVDALFGALKGMLKPLVASQPQVALTFAETTLPPLRTDEAKLAQILRNLISNALKYTEHGEVRVAAIAVGDNVEFTVADTGIGIAAGDHERIFQEFHQVEHALQAKVKGTGLGLPLARKLARLLGGEISVASRPGSGSTFTVRIPRVHRGGDDALPGAPGGRPTALVIDDDEASRYLARGTLERGGFAVHEASGGVAGLDLAASVRPSLIVLDLSMDDLSGFEVHARLRADPVLASIPVVVRSSHPIGASERARLPGVAGFLAKAPCDPEHEWSSLRQVLVASRFPFPESA